jgi:predicted aspartyl protease
MKKVIITGCLLIAGLVCGVNAQSFTTKSAGKNQAVELSLDREMIGRTPTIDVVVNGKVRQFYFDTGGGISFISPEMAKEIGCEPFGGGQMGYDAGGHTSAMKRCEDVEMKLAGYTVKKDVAVFDPMMFFPKVNGKLDGSIALDAFDNQIITVDLIKNRLYVETEKTFKNRIKDMKPLQSRLSREISGATLDIFVAANTPKGKLWMLFDTGNTNKMLFTPAAQELLGIDLKSKNGEKVIKPVKLDIVGLGTIEADSRERAMIYDGMLSYDVIEKLLFTIDFRTGKMWAKMNQ